MLILGCGNPDRADDSAGLLVAARLRELGIDARSLGGDMLALIDEWSSEQEMIIVDAVVSGAAPGAITTWDACKATLPTGCFFCSTHALGVTEAVELARALGRLPRRLIVYGIEAINFDAGGSLSPEVAATVERLAQDLLRLRLIGRH
jgi:hydrogenase maturation protease